MFARYCCIFLFATEAPEVDDPNLPQIESSNGLHRSLLPRESFVNYYQ